MGTTLGTPEQLRALVKEISTTKRVDFRWLDQKEIDRIRVLFDSLYNSERLSTTEIARKLGKSQLFAWSMCRRLGISLRSREDGGRLYAPKRTPNVRKQFGGSNLDRAYLKGLSQGDLDVRRVSKLAIMVSSTTTHPDFVSLFVSLFRGYGPVYIYPVFDRASGYRWKVAARLDNSFEFMLPERRLPFPGQTTKSEFFAWLAGLVDSDGSIGIIHDGRYARVNLENANEDLELLEHIKKQLLQVGYFPSGPYKGHPKGHTTPSRNIRYQADMFHLLLQRSDEFKAILSQMKLRHPEKLVRQEFIQQHPKPRLWKRVGAEVESSRQRVESMVNEYVKRAEVSYNGTKHKKWGESPTSRLSRA
ncbi:MAG: hypothetical protein KGI26_05170 [Thaumarchaeota archaeon]|nr:hypothetical protein [Nitrososphaerota archaeon]